jgi:hypothetical protein
MVRVVVDGDAIARVKLFYALNRGRRYKSIGEPPPFQHGAIDFIAIPKVIAIAGTPIAATVLFSSGCGYLSFSTLPGILGIAPVHDLGSGPEESKGRYYAGDAPEPIAIAATRQRFASPHVSLGLNQSVPMMA